MWQLYNLLPSLTVLFNSILTCNREPNPSKCHLSLTDLQSLFKQKVMKCLHGFQLPQPSWYVIIPSLQTEDCCHKRHPSVYEKKPGEEHWFSSCLQTCQQHSVQVVSIHPDVIAVAHQLSSAVARVLLIVVYKHSLGCVSLEKGTYLQFFCLNWEFSSLTDVFGCPSVQQLLHALMPVVQIGHKSSCSPPLLAYSVPSSPFLWMLQAAESIWPSSILGPFLFSLPMGLQVPAVQPV